MYHLKYLSKFHMKLLFLDVIQFKVLMLFLLYSYIDSGRNPQLYTKDCIEKALTKNEQVRGKIDAYRKFKAHLLVELNNSFPNELNKYRAIRGDERPLA